MRRWRTLLGLLAGGVLLGGCTLVPTSASPQALAAKSVPFGLLGRTIPDTGGARVRFSTEPIYLIDAAGHLTPASRIVPSPATITSVLNQLFLGPSPIEASAGYHSLLGTSVRLQGADVQDGVAFLELSSPLASLTAPRQLLIEGQLALTAHDVGASGIVVSVGGAIQQLLLTSGAHSIVADASDFSTLLDG